MPNKHYQMRLSPDEERFLRRWMYDEVHFQEGRGPAKQMQLQHQVLPAELAVIIAASMPNLADPDQAAIYPSDDPIAWPWSEETLRDRIAEARELLAEGSVAN